VGSGGAATLLTNTTTWLAIGFFVISLVLGNLTANRTKSVDEWNNLSTPVSEQTIATDAIPDESAESATISENSDVPAADAPVTKSDDSDVPK
jgi:preprotein translocase subunit SecG